jgi:hypothetical protein
MAPPQMAHSQMMSHAQAQALIQQLQANFPHQQAPLPPQGAGAIGPYPYESQPWNPEFSDMFSSPQSGGGISNLAGDFNIPPNHLPTPPPEHTKDEKPVQWKPDKSNNNGPRTLNPEVLMQVERPIALSGSTERSPISPRQRGQGQNREDEMDHSGSGEDLPDADAFSTATTAICCFKGG